LAESEYLTKQLGGGLSPCDRDCFAGAAKQFLFSGLCRKNRIPAFFDNAENAGIMRISGKSGKKIKGARRAAPY